MDNKEVQLEQVAERAIRNAERLNLAPPIFELYAALVSMSLSVAMFMFPQLIEGAGGFFHNMEGIMSQGSWGIGFFIGGVVSAVGMLANSRFTRIAGLLVMSCLFGALTGIYASLLPNFGFILMLWITIFTVASIPLVRYTGIWNINTKGERVR